MRIPSARPSCATNRGRRRIGVALQMPDLNREIKRGAKAAPWRGGLDQKRRIEGAQVWRRELRGLQCWGKDVGGDGGLAGCSMLFNRGTRNTRKEVGGLPDDHGIA